MINPSERLSTLGCGGKSELNCDIITARGECLDFVWKIESLLPGKMVGNKRINLAELKKPPRCSSFGIPTLTQAAFFATLQERHTMPKTCNMAHST